MARLGALILALMTFIAAPLRAEQEPVLVELFTSQGCSTCPPAEALLHDLAARQDVVALSMHVDYWDYIGWKDVFARPENTARQRGYAAVSGRRMVYTPQMIVNGSDDVMGAHPKDVAALIERHRAVPRRVSLTAEREDGMLRVAADAMAGADEPCLVQLIRFRPRATTEVTRGENAGYTLSHANVVTEIIPLAEWDLGAPLDIEVPISGDLPAVVVIQQGRFGPVEAVARVE